MHILKCYKFEPEYIHRDLQQPAQETNPSSTVTSPGSQLSLYVRPKGSLIPTSSNQSKKTNNNYNQPQMIMTWLIIDNFPIFHPCFHFSTNQRKPNIHPLTNYVEHPAPSFSRPTDSNQGLPGDFPFFCYETIPLLCLPLRLCEMQVMVTTVRFWISSLCLTSFCLFPKMIYSGHYVFEVLGLLECL